MMFEDMDFHERKIIFLALKGMIKSGANSSILFHNGDPGHPIYRCGATGEELGYGPSPDANPLFRMLSELAQVFKNEGNTNWPEWYDFSDWQSFCKFVVQEHERRRIEV